MFSKSFESNRLLNSISKDRCLPFIGPETFRLATKDDISSNLLEKYTYPLKKGDPLTKVSQYISIKYNDLSAKVMVAEYLTNVKTPDFKLNPESPYAILSSFDLPIYITTNYDHFMEEALRSRGKEPVSDFCRWSEDLATYAKRAGLRDVFDPANNYTPSSAKPLVYHLHGDMDTPQSMVLTEKDYFDFLINIHKLTDTTLPSNVTTKLTTSRLLFLGYNIEDITFRVIFHGIISLFNTMTETRLAVSLQLKNPNIKKEQMNSHVEYLKEYATKLYNIQIIDDELDEFLRTLSIAMDQYKKEHQTNSKVSIP